MSDEELLVKKYGNRRLYDTETSHYITLDDLAQIIKAGRDVKVVDAKSNKDLTKLVLLQIISEREKEHDLLPVSFLKKMIQLSDHAISDSLNRYLRVSLDAFLTAQQEFEERYKSFAGTMMNPLGSIGSIGNFNPLMWPMSMFEKKEESQPSSATPPPAAAAEKAAAKQDPDSTRKQLRHLQEQMSQMQTLLDQLKKE
jgi:polyhydroxyalkanoate synthesis repressor PhaR